MRAGDATEPDNKGIRLAGRQDGNAQRKERTLVFMAAPKNLNG
jgi:hypothetical protein